MLNFVTHVMHIEETFSWVTISELGPETVDQVLGANTFVLVLAMLIIQCPF